MERGTRVCMYASTMEKETLFMHTRLERNVCGQGQRGHCLNYYQLQLSLLYREEVCNCPCCIGKKSTKINVKLPVNVASSLSPTKFKLTGAHMEYLVIRQ